jgi:hypothetical protein
LFQTSETKGVIMGNIRTVTDIKQNVKQLIEENAYREISPLTKFKGSGIYMIFIDHFTSNACVPIYIGQAKDIQKRYKQHLQEILVLNRLSYEEYHKYFFSNSSSFYEGKLKACKMFKYMVDHQCSLKGFRMVVLEEVDEDHLDEKEQEYFRRLLPSYYGFNQLNSFLKKLEFRFMEGKEGGPLVKDFLRVFEEDIERIEQYYEYGFTRFNFEHSLPTNLTFLLREGEVLDKDLQTKFDEVKCKLTKLCRRLKPEYEEKLKIIEELNTRSARYNATLEDYKETLDVLKQMASEKLKELKIWDEEALENFIGSIKMKGNPDYELNFKKYFKRKKVKLDFYKLFEKQIEKANEKWSITEEKRAEYWETLNLYEEKENLLRHERYKMIFPSGTYENFPLKDLADNLISKPKVVNGLSNVCSIQIYLSNNALTRSLEVRKEPYIVRIDYHFVGDEGKDKENQFYIDNETTRNALDEVRYIEKDFYNTWAIRRKERFVISSIMDHEVDNSFISVLAEYNHGINDHTLQGKALVNISKVIEEIQQLVDAETGYNVGVSESYRCLEMAIWNENLKDDKWVELLVSKKLPKAKKRKKKNKSASKERKPSKKVSREEAYKQKVLERSNGSITVTHYVSSRENVTAQCKSCGHKWKKRSDHLLRRPYCPLCSKGNI